MKHQKLIAPKLIRKELENIRNLNDTAYFKSMILLMEEITLRQLELLKKELRYCENTTVSLKFRHHIHKQISECRELLKDLYEMRDNK